MTKFSLFPYKLDNLGVYKRSLVVSINLIMDLHDFHTASISDTIRLEKVSNFNMGLPSPIRKIILLNSSYFINPSLMQMRFEDNEYLIRCTRITPEKWLFVYYWHI